MSPLAELLRAAGAAFDRLGAGWFVFGAQAAILHGAARLTADVDITVALGTRSLEELLAALEEQGFASRGEKPIDFARRTRVLPVVHGGTGFPVDVIVAGPGLEERFLERREQRMLDGVCVPLVRAEERRTAPVSRCNSYQPVQNHRSRGRVATHTLGVMRQKGFSSQRHRRGRGQPRISNRMFPREPDLARVLPPSSTGGAT